MNAQKQENTLTVSDGNVKTVKHKIKNVNAQKEKL